MPSLQNAIDMVPGWVGQMPPETGLRAGAATLYADTRIDWLLKDCFAISGKAVLELGPLEAFTPTCCNGPGPPRSMRSKQFARLREMLVTKEALKLDRRQFLSRRLLAWLEQSDKCYDLVVASAFSTIRTIRFDCFS